MIHINRYEVNTHSTSPVLFIDTNEALLFSTKNKQNHSCSPYYVQSRASTSPQHLKVPPPCDLAMITDDTACTRQDPESPMSYRTYPTLKQVRRLLFHCP